MAAKDVPGGSGSGRGDIPSAPSLEAEQAEGTKTRTGVSAISRIYDRPVSKDAAFVVLHGQDLGRRYMLAKGDTLVGRSSTNDICVDQESASRRHARLSRSGRTVTIEDLESKNGTLVNDKAVAKAKLRNGDLVRIGRTIFKFLSGGNLEQLYHEEVYRLTTIDGLTQCYNRRYFLEQLEREMGRCQRYGRLLTVALFDVDDFKAINDTHGHVAGDRVLADVAALVRSRIRREDFLARLGGDEFALALPEITLAQGLVLGSRLCELIGKRDFGHEGNPLALTISMGLFEHQGKAVEAAVLLRQADEKLYDAKRRGKNRACA